VVLGPEEELLQTKMTVRNFNLQKTDLLTEPIEALTKIRYKDPGALSTIRQVDNHIEVVFHSQVKAIAPGQSAVFYDGDDVIGGGFIEKSLENQH
jgi:tRNA-specific 2-thiouridylase